MYQLIHEQINMADAVRFRYNDADCEFLASVLCIFVILEERVCSTDHKDSEF